MKIEKQIAYRINLSEVEYHELVQIVDNYECSNSNKSTEVSNERRNQILRELERYSN